MEENYICDKCIHNKVCQYKNEYIYLTNDLRTNASYYKSEEADNGTYRHRTIKFNSIEWIKIVDPECIYFNDFRGFE